MSRIYISIPVTGRDYERQKRKAQKVADYYREKGLDPVLPFDIVHPEATTPQAMSRCIQELLQCENVVFIDDWWTSRGCQVEMATARAYDLKIHRHPKIDLEEDDR